MTLRAIAERDLATLLEDDVCGMAWPITLTDPEGNSAPLKCHTTDIGLVIDPDTGVAASGRQATASVRISSILSAGLTLPRGVADTSGMPWLVAFDDINGVPYTFKVNYSDPDRTLGVVVLQLGLWQA